MKPVPWYILPIVGILFLAVSVFSFKQCSTIKTLKFSNSKSDSLRQKAIADYIALVKAKQKSDTVYRKTKPVTIHDSIDRPVIDTSLVEGKKVYSQYKDSLIGVGIRLRTTAVAVDLKSLSYTYDLDQQIINKEHIVYVHDTTLVPEKPKGHLYGIGDLKLTGGSIGLHWQSRKKLGASVRYDSDRNFWAGISYKIF